ncbi:hypothetical protein SAMN06265337_3581 [Hymenobacter gelipurpurascens]|uniref:Outer membrane protein beta-barrel domain-containing protein n=1 Tax=Hymenobacter gelipurpurascens TaxID=89968 RepID=A0A212UEZ1_9BACT|nr:hypothetical protein [Hymenobacter gelipurpurascens]SNC76825.1 hypothetical protein SAMN06265337_3581 [Hymenobacter gelipurpurascens]
MGRKHNLLLGIVAYGSAMLPARVAAQTAPVPAAGPFFLTLHVAGGIGLVALGGGYRLAHQRLEPELLVGYLPRRLAGRPTAIITLKTTYLPFSPRLGHSRWELSPVAVGGMVNYTTGRQYFLTNNTAGRYRPGYYWWSSAVRVGALAGMRLTRVGHSAAEYAPRTSLYSEFSTNDLHLVSALTNRSLKLTDILTLGAGVKR